MVECPVDTALLPGSWYLWRTGKVRVFLSCPSCGGITLVSLDDVNDDGLLVSEFQCLRPLCGFHDGVKLLGWSSSRS